jgi:hypothetical protein
MARADAEFYPDHGVWQRAVKHDRNPGSLIHRQLAGDG